ncbi:hypothetical protein KW076_06310 [Micrococcus porci]|uniref:hypothetical protein n=1 Tax=Micrococcus TaxID=1269 RepID=UPI001CCF8F89|nr:hypothetical protein [Micrococcus porci]MCG7421798.1 hypothetical protein [Micrococcus sp. ACRRV]UBH25777.1 hypothetical protein KW076_06310 [Micrococcus porci]
MPAPAPEPRHGAHPTTAAPVPSAGGGAAVAARRGRRRPAWRDVLPGLALGVGTGALGTATHLSLLPVGSWLLPWGLVLALVLVGSTQRWWMRRAAAAGGRPVRAGAAVVLAAFTMASALRWLPATDRLDLPWTAGVAQAMPVAFAASVGWTLGLPVLGVVLLWLGARAGEGRAAGESTLERTPNPVPARKVDGQP